MVNKLYFDSLIINGVTLAGALTIANFNLFNISSHTGYGFTTSTHMNLMENIPWGHLNIGDMKLMYLIGQMDFFKNDSSGCHLTLKNHLQVLINGGSLSVV